MSKKRAISMPFNWLFAIIAGGIILFLAVYAAIKIIDTGGQETNTETAARLTALLDPMGTGLASGKSAQINFQRETKTYYECDSNGDFGKNRIAFAEKTLGNSYGDKGGYINTKKYVFAKHTIEGKQLNLFSKPFYMPFKIDDVIEISSGEYCFYDAPQEIKEEVQGLGIKNFYFSEDLENCTGTKVCFGSSYNCDIDVYGLCQGYGCESQYDYGRLVKEGKTMYYTDSLLYGAIVSSPEIYECNVKRLMKRFEKLSLVYIDKIKIIEIKNCGSNMEADLISLAGMAHSLNKSEDLYLISETAKMVNAKNMAAGCKLY